MKRKIVSGILLSLIAMLMFNIQPVARAQEKTEIVIGVAESQTGVQASGCMMHHAYYTMIVEDYNNKGGLYVPELGTRLPVRLERRDDESDLETCLTKITELITVEHVDLMFAPWSTAFCVAAFSLFEEHKYPVVALTIGSDDASERMKSGEIKYSFVTLGQPYEDAIEIVEMFEYINEEHPTDPISRVGIIYRADQHGEEHSEAISNALEDADFEVPVCQAYTIGTMDYVPLIETLRDANVDVAMLCGYDEAQLFIRDCMAEDYNPKLIFHGPVLETPLMVYIVFGFTRAEFHGMCYYDGFPAVRYDETPELEEWAANHTSRLGWLPFPASAPAFYAGLDCLFQAVELVGLNRTKIRDALATETFDTIVGSFKFQVGHSPEIEFSGTLTQWQGGEMMEVIWPPEAASADITYPKRPWSWAYMPDFNMDGIVDVRDIARVAKAYGTVPGDENWDDVVDLDDNDLVDIRDVARAAKEYGQTPY